MKDRFPIYDQDVAKRLTIVRKMTKLPQKQFGALLGYGHQRYCGFETGRSAIPFYVINLVIQNIRLFGIVVTQDWLVFGQGEAPYFIEDFDEKVGARLTKTIEDPLTQFFIHALSLSKIYSEKLTLFEGGTDYEPHIPSGTFIVAPKMEADHFNPNWEGYYLHPHKQKIILVKLVRTQKNSFNITSLHASELRRVALKEQKLSHLYPAIGLLSNYSVALSDATDITSLIQQQRDVYSTLDTDTPLETEDA